MKWSIPAKTFLLGEYAALEGASALLVTTQPCFEIKLENDKRSTGIHPESPAGLWWKQQELIGHELGWFDPYKGCGGLGASSAQFIGSYLASCSLKKIPPTLSNMLEAYYNCAWNGQGLRPSGYDVIAQTQYACVYINKQKEQIRSYRWAFNDLSFFLIHTGTKLATHHHLQQTTLPLNTQELSMIVDKAKEAFEQSNSSLFIQSINEYHQQLVRLNLITEHSLHLIEELQTYPEVLAIKGCGALGADILLIITLKAQAACFKKNLVSLNKKILASEADLTQEKQKLLNL